MMYIDIGDDIFFLLILNTNVMLYIVLYLGNT